MDPNETLTRIRELVGAETPFKEARWDQMVGALELFEALDEWLSNGGFTPEPWSAWLTKTQKAYIKGDIK